MEIENTIREEDYGVKGVALVSWLKPEDAQMLKDRFKDELKADVTIHVFTRDESIIVPGRPPTPYAREIKEIMTEVAELADKLRLQVHDGDTDKEALTDFGIERLPALALTNDLGEDFGIRFYGLPSGYDFASFLEAIFFVSAGDIAIEDESLKRRILAIDKPVQLKIFVTPT